MILDPAREAGLHAEVADLGAMALRAHDAVDVFEAACRALRDALECPSAVVLRVTSAPDSQVVLAAGLGVPPGIVVEDSWPAQPNGAVEQALAAREVVALTGLPDDPYALPQAMRTAGFRSAIAVPIPLEGETWGILSAASPEVGQFVGIDRAFVLSVVNIVAGFLERDVVQERLLHQSLHDELTGLPNRSLLFDRIEHAQERAERGDLPFVLMLVDLDDFKDVNDGYGHVAGDELLRELAHRFREVLRPGDTVSRLGGDEFVLLCEEVSGPLQVDALVRRIMSALGGVYRLPGAEVEIQLSGSVGLTHGSPEGDPTMLLQEADAAMYVAKRAGGGQWSVFEPALRVEAQARALEAGELRNAIDGDELRVHYQPVVDADLVIVGVEALVRWEHPRRGLVGADQVVPAAERTGLISAVGAWVRRTAMAQVAVWQGASPARTPLRLAVNVSARELVRPGFVEEILLDLRGSALLAGTLDLELTESTLVADIPRAVAALTRFRAAGARTLIDDFGTGFCSLSVLSELPIAGLKVDRSFTAGVPESQTHLAIIRSVTSLARDLGLEVVAEGIETQAQRRTLLDLGCRLAQGYLWSPPVDATALGHLLERQARGEQLWSSEA